MVGARNADLEVQSLAYDKQSNKKSFSMFIENGCSLNDLKVNVDEKYTVEIDLEICGQSHEVISIPKYKHVILGKIWLKEQNLRSIEEH
ncbi:hypothetical protein CCR75_001878 [Bremia lactucae]|uniref:Uncharacterized protein n=1 Tax=Bremia lactucae TaxID=4779 RepID=A0A976FI96_BRELC|nr:hypothetical protein CCR75_001878 [Bremia lactucae]